MISSFSSAVMGSSSSPRYPPPTLRPSDLNLTLSPPQPPPPPPHPTPAAPLHHHHNHHHHHLSHLRIRLTELLLTCAAHTATSNLPRAEACLRLISSLSSDSGDSTQRLAARLATSLASRLLRSRWAGLLSALRHPAAASPRPTHHLAFARALPYLPVAHAVAGCTVLRSLAHERSVHLLDLGSSRSSADLWVPLLRALSHQSAGPPNLRLTCVGPDPHVLDSLGSTLAKEAETLDIPLRFDQVNSSLIDLDLSSIRVRPGEALAVVSILTLHELLAELEDGEESAAAADEEEEAADEEEEEEEPAANPRRWRRGRRMEGFLSDLRLMSPKVVVVVEQETDHSSGRMVERFGEALHYYGAVFDSIEAAATDGLMTAEERMAVEEMVGREMENVVACDGEERVERHERTERWVERMRRAGFRQSRVWYDAVEEARRVVASWSGKGGYGVVIDRGCLMISWKDRPLYAVSVWQSYI